MWIGRMTAIIPLLLLAAQAHADVFSLQVASFQPNGEAIFGQVYLGNLRIDDLRLKLSFSAPYTIHVEARGVHADCAASGDAIRPRAALALHLIGVDIEENILAFAVTGSDPAPDRVSRNTISVGNYRPDLVQLVYEGACSM
jgi:hypothetical protein